MIEVRGINHVTIRVSNLRRSLEFYIDILGAKLVHKGNTDVYLDMGGTWLCLLEFKNAKPMDKEHICIDHFAFTVTEDHFPDAVKELIKHKVNITRGPIERGGGKSINFTDPDGNELEFFTGTLYQRMKNWK
ncbi:metallothiol transferase FosB [Fictibacillus barbaricus]|nr:VOC family protein [Fictibacillus barbaricus]GGB66593.1 metallothiol transferase FosB [Fictibacillus barbaricus]